MTDYKQLVERLRNIQVGPSYYECNIAANAIESLTAELAKYRDAPVVAYVPEQTLTWLRKAQNQYAYCRCDVSKGSISPDYVPLIVKPGE